MIALPERQIAAADRMLKSVNALLVEISGAMEPCAPMLAVRNSLTFCIGENQRAILARDGLVDVHAEMGIIGGLMLDMGKLPLIKPLVREDDFYDDSNRRIFAHERRLIDRHEWPDPVTLWNSLRSTNEASLIAGGFDYLADIARETPSAANIGQYARIVRSKAEERRQREATNGL
jgi:hypothetical protein